MAAERIPKPLNKRGCSWTSFNSLNLSIVDLMWTFLWFSESLERNLSNDVLQSNLSFFGLGPWAIIHDIAKLVNTFISQTWFLMTPFKLFFRSFLKIPKPKESPIHWINGGVVEHLSTALTWVSLIQCQNFWKRPFKWWVKTLHTHTGLTTVWRWCVEGASS